MEARIIGYGGEEGQLGVTQVRDERMVNEWNIVERGVRKVRKVERGEWKGGGSRG